MYYVLVNDEKKIKKILLLLIVLLVPIGLISNSQTKIDFKETAKLGSDWLVQDQNKDGTFRYKYYLSSGQYSLDDNIVRQMCAAYGLATAYNFFGDKKYFDASKLSIDHAISISKTYKLGNKTGRFLPFKGDVKSNAVAVLVLAIVELSKNNPQIQSEYSNVLKELAFYITQSYTEKDVFLDRYDVTSGTYFKKDDYDYNTGESLLALIELEKIMPDKSNKEIISKASSRLMQIYSDEMKTPFYGWGAKAYLKLYEENPQTEYRDFIFQMTDKMMQTDYFAQGKTTIVLSVFLEGLIPVSSFAYDMKDAPRHRLYHNKAINALSRLEKLQIKSKGDLSDEVYSVVRGAFCSNPLCMTVRVDNNQHGIMANISAIQFGF